jgi:ribose 5-phosphate isomerase A
MSEATVTVDVEAQKREAALAALGHVQSGMVLGLGSGSTSRHFIVELAERLKHGELRDVFGVATSLASAALATELGIALIELPETGVDLAVDGADEINPQLNLTKGMGGALLREKIVEASAREFIVIGDESKLVRTLGEKSKIPLEVASFGLAATLKKLRDLGGEPHIRSHNGQPVLSDNGNLIVECAFKPITNTWALDLQLHAIAGVLETGIFIDLATLGYVATSNGVARLEKHQVMK